MGAQLTSQFVQGENYRVFVRLDHRSTGKSFPSRWSAHLDDVQAEQPSLACMDDAFRRTQNNAARD